MKEKEVSGFGSQMVVVGGVGNPAGGAGFHGKGISHFDARGVRCLWATRCTWLGLDSRLWSSGENLQCQL